jgi:hypothetical protein
MSYEEEDTCHMRTRINGVRTWTRYMSYEEEDTCHTHTSNDNIINRI